MTITELTVKMEMVTMHGNFVLTWERWVEEVAFWFCLAFVLTIRNFLIPVLILLQSYLHWFLQGQHGYESGSSLAAVLTFSRQNIKLVQNEIVIVVINRDFKMCYIVLVLQVRNKFMVFFKNHDLVIMTCVHLDDD